MRSVMLQINEYDDDNDDARNLRPTLSPVDKARRPLVVASALSSPLCFDTVCWVSDM